MSYNRPGREPGDGTGVGRLSSKTRYERSSEAVVGNRRPWALRLLLVFVSTALALALAEGWARWTYRNVLDLRGEFRGFETYPSQLNRLGFREAEPTAEILSDQTRRVLFLGDSFTFGSGVDDPRERFTDRLEAELGSGFHLYNAGIPGSRPSDWFGFARTLLPRYRPAVVIAVFSLRDGTDLGTSLVYHEDRIAELRAKHCDGVLDRHSYLARTICERRALAEFSAWYLGEFRTAYLGTGPERRTWGAMQQALLALRDLCRAQGAPFHLVVFPLLFDLRDYAFHDVEAEILGFAARNDIPALSLIRGFEGLDERELWVSAVDQHPSVAGHRIAAETLLPYLKTILGTSSRSPSS